MRNRMSLSAALKAGVRRGVWRMGYDIVPLASSFTDVLTMSLRSCDLLIDVGANTGQFAERARSLGYQGKIISFEPSRQAFAVLAERAAHDAAWEVRNVAIGANEGEATLNISANSKSSSLLPIGDRHVRVAPKSAVVSRETVSVIPLDDEVTHTGFDRAFLKLDVQGFEGEVLQGAADTLHRTRTVQCELSVVPLYDGQADYIELMRILREAGLPLVQLEPEFQDPTTGVVLQLEALFQR